MARGDGPSGGDQEKAQENDQVREQSGHRQTDNEAQQETERQPSPPQPPRPLPPPHQASLGSQAQLQRQAVRFAPLPAGYPPPLLVDPEPPFFPQWHKAKLALGCLSLVTSAVIIAIGIALGYHNIQYDYSLGAAETLFGVSGTAAGLAILVTTIEFLKTCLSSKRRGLHPGILVAFHLIVWLAALIAVVGTALSSDVYYSVGMMQSVIYGQVLLGFDSVLLLTHFILFVGACVETNRFEKTRMRTKNILITVPANYPDGPYTFYGSPQSLGLQPGAKGGQYPLPVICPVPPQQAVLYGGYYAPPPPAMRPMGPQQQANPALLQGYYAPTAVPVETPGANVPAQNPQQEPVAAAASRPNLQPNPRDPSKYSNKTVKDQKVRRASKDKSMGSGSTFVYLR
ncbi:MARVEL domain-containing protein [Madurella fahalii]|uniref:MARVEL domain-containing protein n=1 Tax=Madurella fahalii TaxID=1157608 RepID=A0ABQ0GNN7_9PEZI